MEFIMKSILLIFLMFFCVQGQESNFGKITFHPISHATFVINIDTTTIYVDPVGGSEAFAGQRKPDIILITHTHGDHLNKETITVLKTNKTRIIGPKSVVDEIQMGEILNNDEKVEIGAITIKAIPMYNLTEDRKKFHPKGLGNGYLISALDKKIYISGDTEDIPEMRQLKNIDYAFVCMNLPYTMSVEQAASAVLEMKPKYVFPYHHKGSDLEKFKELVSKDKNIKVEILKWY